MLRKLFPVAAAIATIAVAHTCIHDTPAIQEEIRSSMRKQIAPQKYHPKFHPLQARASLRIVTSTLDLDDTTKFCTAAGQTRPDFAGGTLTCTADDVFTAEKKNILLTNVIPAALARLTATLQVSRVAGNLIVPAGACPRHTIPASHTTTGVPNADFVLYVSAGPTTGNTLAWAGGCVDDANGRTVVGRANFGPSHISWSASTPTSNQDQVDTAVHELIHALGFSATNFQRMRATRQITIRGKTTTILTTTNVVAKYREYFGCTTLEGPEIEDEGGTGSAGSHWDRRVLKDELMAASGGNLLSEMTMAFMEDTGHYTANYAGKDSMTFARGAGCGFVTERCNTPAGGSGTYWCFEQNNAITSCTKGWNAIGFCAVETLETAAPAHFQYFSNPLKSGPQFLDGCPYISAFQNRICTDSSIVASDSDLVLGNNFSAHSRCWDVNEVIADGFVARNSGNNRCFESQCVAGRPMFRINGSSWVNCPTDGAVVTLTEIDWRGTVTCPVAAEFCAAGIPVYTSTEAPPQTAAPQQESSSTISTTLVLSGDAWEYFFNTTKLSIILQNAIRKDIAAFLDMLVEDVILDDMTIGSLHLRVGLLTFRWTPSGVEDEFNAAINSGGVAWMPLTSALYLNMPNASGTTRLVSVTTELNTKFCSDPNNPKEDFCLIVIAVIIIAVVLIICCIIGCVKSCCGETDEDRIAAGAVVGTAAVLPGSPRKGADENEEAAKIQRLYRARKAKKQMMINEKNDPKNFV